MATNSNSASSANPLKRVRNQKTVSEVKDADGKVVSRRTSTTTITTESFTVDGKRFTNESTSIPLDDDEDADEQSEQPKSKRACLGPALTKIKTKLRNVFGSTSSPSTSTVTESTTTPPSLSLSSWGSEPPVDKEVKEGKVEAKVEVQVKPIQSSRFRVKGGAIRSFPFKIQPSLLATSKPSSLSSTTPVTATLPVPVASAPVGETMKDYLHSAGFEVDAANSTSSTSNGFVSFKRKTDKLPKSSPALVLLENFNGKYISVRDLESYAPLWTTYDETRSYLDHHSNEFQLVASRSKFTHAVLMHPSEDARGKWWQSTTISFPTYKATCDWLAIHAKQVFITKNDLSPWRLSRKVREIAERDTASGWTDKYVPNDIALSIMFSDFVKIYEARKWHECTKAAVLMAREILYADPVMQSFANTIAGIFSSTDALIDGVPIFDGNDSKYLGHLKKTDLLYLIREEYKVAHDDSSSAGYQSISTLSNSTSSTSLYSSIETRALSESSSSSSSTLTASASSLPPAPSGMPAVAIVRAKFSPFSPIQQGSWIGSRIDGKLSPLYLYVVPTSSSSDTVSPNTNPGSTSTSSVTARYELMKSPDVVETPPLSFKNSPFIAYNNYSSEDDVVTKAIRREVAVTVADLCAFFTPAIGIVAEPAAAAPVEAISEPEEPVEQVDETSEPVEQADKSEVEYVEPIETVPVEAGANDSNWD